MRRDPLERQTQGVVDGGECGLGHSGIWSSGRVLDEG
jgi:hypothetical protein